MTARSNTAAPSPSVRWGFYDRVLAAVAPQAAARRLAARMAIERMRGYDGAQRGRETDGWQAAGTSADSEIAIAGPMLRQRMRDLVRNNPLAAQAVQVLVNNIVGPGIRPRAASGDPGVNARADALWAAWSRRCDRHGHTDFHGLTALAVREMVEGGDVFALRRPGRAGDGPVPLTIELREADHLDAARFDSRADGVRIDQGIEYDRSGRRAAFWMFPDHPGNRSPVFGRTLESVRHPAEGVAHLFERQRIQSRGVPWGTAAMRPIRDVDDWQRAELVRKKTEACLVGIVFGADEAEQSIAPVVEDGEGNRIEQFEPGLVAYARNGKDIKFNQPASTGGVYEWHRVQLHIVSAGFRVPYALMTGDLSQANFASSRVGLNEFRRMVDQLQWQTVIPMFCDPVWDWFVALAQTGGQLPSGVAIPAEWAPPRFESVNPLQDAQADLLEVRAGFSTLKQQIARRGYDPNATLVEWAETAAAIDALGLVLDSDPRKVTKAGLVQTGDTGDSAAPRREADQ
ncbi:phage portal protein [uncultured Amaricoccus sp.]|uniref:phage portal protein n=1 Tax=uncultured Amaricoccus sp. TaxID=339341 RepID=UPI00261DD863|nr:phage portal protein [uncultured Amaricoccus sp.]